MKNSHKLLSLAVMAALSGPALAEVPIDVIGGSEVSFEGMLQADINDFSSDIQNLNGDAIDGTDVDGELRRAEFVLKGKGPGQWEWVAGYDAKADKFLDVNVRYKFSGFTSITVGQFKQPNSMEELGSTKNNDFISKSMTTNTQAIARRTGVQVATGGDDWTLTGSMFGRELTRNLAQGRGYGVRGTWAPINSEGNVLHLGLSYVTHDSQLDSFQFRTRPNADLSGRRLIDSGALTRSDDLRTAGFEAAYFNGPIKLQGEYMKTDVNRYVVDDYGFDSWYVQGVWNITGETWGYRSGNITTGLPDDPAKGMWQLGLRYDSMDLNDGAVTSLTPLRTVGVLGGEESNWTLGVNYYWRSNFKFMLNYVKVDSSRFVTRTAANYSTNPAFNNVTFNRVLDDNPSILEFRAQFYW